LIEPQHYNGAIEGEMVYVSEAPTIVEEHAAKLTFPSGILPQFYTGSNARDKAIEIMTSSSATAKCFVMSFECSQNGSTSTCPLLKSMNPQNKLFAICLSVDDFTLVPNWTTELIMSEKVLGSPRTHGTHSTKILPFEEIDMNQHHEV
jgi:hypothetical protein